MLVTTLIASNGLHLEKIIKYIKGMNIEHLIDCINLTHYCFILLNDDTYLFQGNIQLFLNEQI